MESGCELFCCLVVVYYNIIIYIHLLPLPLNYNDNNNNSNDGVPKNQILYFYFCVIPLAEKIKNSLLLVKFGLEHRYIIIEE
jgi:hypothetical protein